MIICSTCGWKSENINECDAEAEFSNHVMEQHIQKSNIDSSLQKEINKNINIIQFSIEKDVYAIYVNGSSIHYYSNTLFPDNLILQKRSKNSLTSLKSAISLAKDISKYLGLNIYLTKGVYSDSRHVCKIA